MSVLRRSIGGAVAGLLGLVAGTTGTAAEPSRIDRIVDAAATPYVADRCHAGLSIVVRAEGRDHFYNYGLADRARRRAPTSDSVYELASMTKTFAGVLAARALVEGRMTLDEDFRTYLAAPYPNLAFEGRPITLRTLATHTSGIQRDLPDSDALMAKPDYARIGAQLAALNRGFDRDHSLAALHDVRLRSSPGARFAYSNIGIRLIGYGLEGVYHQRFERLLQSAVLDRLMMRETRFTLTPAMRARLTVPYARDGSVQPFHDASAGAAYGLYSTPRDMARYLAWQLDERDPVIARAHQPIRGSGEDGEGLIWNLGRDGDTAMLWHGGGAFGETSQMVLYPRDRIGLVLLANDACEGSEAALKQIAMRVHRDLH